MWCGGGGGAFLKMVDNSPRGSWCVVRLDSPMRAASEMGNTFILLAVRWRKRPRTVLELVERAT